MSWKLPTLTALGIVILYASLNLLTVGSCWMDENPLSPLMKSLEEGRRLDEIDRSVMARIEAKTLLIDEVVANRMSLVEAAARFRSLAEAGLDQPMRVLQFLPGDTNEEKFCLQVILWAETHLREVRTSQGNEVLARLRRELAAARGCGEIVLPEL